MCMDPLGLADHIVVHEILGVGAGSGHTIRDDGVDMTQRSALNFVSGTSSFFTLTDDAGSDETEVTLNLDMTPSWTNAHTFTDNSYITFEKWDNLGSPSSIAAGRKALFLPLSSGKLSVYDKDSGLTTNVENRVVSHGTLGPSGSVSLIAGEYTYLNFDIDYLYIQDDAASDKTDVSLKMSMTPTWTAKHTWSSTGSIDMQQRSAPSNPASGYRTLFVDSSTGELSVRTSGGTTVSLESGGASGHTIRDDGVDMAARTGLNFVSGASAFFTLTDDAGGDETEVTLDLAMTPSWTGLHSYTASGATGAIEITHDGTGVPAFARRAQKWNCGGNTSYINGQNGAGFFWNTLTSTVSQVATVDYAPYKAGAETITGAWTFDDVQRMDSAAGATTTAFDFDATTARSGTTAVFDFQDGGTSLLQLRSDRLLGQSGVYAHFSQGEIQSPLTYGHYFRKVYNTDDGAVETPAMNCRHELESTGTSAVNRTGLAGDFICTNQTTTDGFYVNVIGGRFYAREFGNPATTPGTCNLLIGGDFYALADSGAANTINDVFAGRFIRGNTVTKTIGTSTGIQVYASSFAGGTTVTNNYGIRVSDQGNSATSTSHAIRIDSQTSGTNPQRNNIRMYGGGAYNGHLQLGSSTSSSGHVMWDTTELVLRLNNGSVSAGTDGIGFDHDSTTTGSTTATLGSNAPTLGSTTPSTWLPVLINASTYYIPLWA